MKIVHVIIGLNIGGAELMLKRLVLESGNTDIEHTIISLTDLGVLGSELQDRGVTVYKLGMSSSLSVPLTLFRLRVLLKKINPNVVQTWMYHADFLGGLAAKSIGVKNIVWGVRTTDVSQGNSKLTVKLSQVCAKLSHYIPDHIICAAHISKDYHISVGYDESKMIVIPNGYDLKLLSSTKEKGLEVRKEFDLHSKDIVVGSVGRFNTVKNQKIFVEAAAILVKKLPDLKFMIVGRENTVDNKELMSWIGEHNLQSNFRLLGQRSDVARCLMAMDIFCLHSKTEGFPNVLCEAMYAGLPCISTDVGDSKLIMQDFGVSVEKDSINQLSDGIYNIVNILLKDKAKLTHQKKQSKEHIVNNFSIGKVSQEYLKVWQS